MSAANVMTQTAKKEPEQTKAKRKQMKRTPGPLRFLVMIGYLEIFRSGVVFSKDALTVDASTADSVVANDTIVAAAHNNVSFDFEGAYAETDFDERTAKLFSQASDAMFFYTLVYLIDTIFASFGYMSMYQHRMKHIFEHHIPGGIFTFLSYLFFKRLSEETMNGNDYPSYYVNALYAMVSAGLLSQACEFYWVFRTFLRSPDDWVWKVGQRLLGLVLVFFLATSSNVVIFTFLGVKYYHEAWTLAESVAFPVLCYLCMYVQPRYTMCHWKRLGRLMSTSLVDEKKKRA